VNFRQAVVEWIRSAQEVNSTKDAGEEVVKNGKKSTSASPSSETSAELNEDHEEPVAVLSPSKRTSTTDEDAINLQKRLAF
jgi:hypothetical protein